jgi:uncharacterized protein (DUF924 family)
MKPAEILEFWFNPPVSDQWYSSDPALDAEIRTRFEAMWAQAKAGKLASWKEADEGTLALIILLDQFSRNMFRGTAKAFASDEDARELAHHAVNQGFDLQTPLARRVFFYLPFMHSENLADQDRSVALIGERCGLDHPSYAFALEHRAAIARFGRYPSRNKALSRASTPEESAYLAQGGRF